MKLLILYGPPASGKFTISSFIAAQTGYKLFHNHLTVPVARALFPASHEPHHSEAYSNLLKQLRLDVIKTAAAEDISLIFTLAYSGAVDDPFIADIVEAVEHEHGQICFVQLSAPNNVLMERVINPSRRQLAKMTEPEHLKQVLKTRDVHATVKYPSVLHISTAELSANQACTRIIEHYRL